ncbi:MAG: entericidin A/B family lipoprotein [Desulfobulbaceae bacterium]|nr:entericidin A/B family lipoprotein [Desulfobulbaceae bacterium]
MSMKKSIKKSLTTVAWVLTLVMLFQIQGCNTMRGAGQDVERAGESIQDAAE